MPVLQKLVAAAREGYSAEYAYLAAALAALAYRPSSEFAAGLSAALGGASVARQEGNTPTAPAVLVVTQGDVAAVAIEGTTRQGQWLSYVTNAALVAWQGAPGLVYAPFSLIAQEVTGTVDTLAPSPARVAFCGHSLGGVVAQLLAHRAAVAGRAIDPVVVLAAPRSCTPGYRAAWPGKGWCISCPGDPVPVTPPDPLDLVDGVPFPTRPTLGLVGIQDGHWPCAAPGPPLTYTQAVAVALAAALAAGQLARHATWRYLSALRVSLSPINVELMEPLTELLDGLGMLDPPPW